MKLLLDLSLAASLSFYNTPYVNQTTLWPNMTVELQPTKTLYVKSINETRCQPTNWHLWNPIVGLWTIEAGTHLGPITLGIGHQSEHGIDIKQSPTESYDYVIMRYHFETE